MCRKLFVLLSLFLVLSSSAFALAPLKRATAETVSTASAKAETSTTTTSSDLSEISEKIDGLLLVSQGTKNELNEQVDALYKDLQDALKESTKTKFFADLGVAFGLKEKALNYGVTGDIGLRFGKGLMLKVGAVYMVGSDFTNISWGLDNLTATATIGWEW
jgi:hypothetical protein